MSNPCGRGRGVLRAPAVLIRRLGLAAMLLLAAPIGVAASTAAAPASTAAPAQVAAKLAAAHLPEPLMAIGPTTPAEDAALLAAVTRYQDRADPDDFAALTGFLAGYPYSAWRVAVSTNLGIVYLHYGYFSRALAAYETAWHEGKDATNPRARALVDRALGELLALDADFGYRQRLAALLTEIGTRPVSGSAAAMLREAQQTLWVMKTDPKHFYLCGPMALKMLLLAQHSTLAQVDFLNWVRADGPQGTNLVEVAALAERVNVSLLPVFRKSGEPVPVPSIVHWRIGHFAALVGERDGRFEVKDPTFGHQSLWVTQEALDAEASGYFLVSAKVAAAGGLRRVAAAEAGHIWGAGFTPNLGSNPKNKNPCSSCTCAGMCGYGINAHDVSLDLNDRPVGYAPPKGPSAVVMLAYDALDQSQPANFGFFNVSQKWTLNWLTYIQDDPTSPGANVSRHPPSGGGRQRLYRLRQRQRHLRAGGRRRLGFGAEKNQPRHLSASSEGRHGRDLCRVERQRDLPPRYIPDQNRRSTGQHADPQLWQDRRPDPARRVERRDRATDDLPLRVEGVAALDHQDHRPVRALRHARL